MQVLIIAGDGYAYVAYSYSNSKIEGQIIGNCDSGFGHNDSHLNILRVASNGSYLEIPVGGWSYDWSRYSHGATMSEAHTGVLATPRCASLITDADQGVVVSWKVNYGAFCAGGGGNGCVSANTDYRLTTITNGSVVSDVSAGTMPGQQEAIVPILQRQDRT